VLASRFQSPERDRGGGDMRLLRIVGKSASSHTKAAAAADPLPDAKDDPDGAGAVTVVAAGADRNNGSVNGTRLSVIISNRICFCYNLRHWLMEGYSSTMPQFLCLSVTVYISFPLLFIYKKSI
jgi:hypothetical protein